MAKVQAAILSDVAYIRDGLVYLLAGGINRVTTELPGTLNVALTVMVELEAIEFGQTHQITVKIVHADSATRVGEASGQFHSGDTSKLGPGEPMLLPLVVPLKGINLPMYGPYDIHVSVNGEPQQLLTFRALAPRR
ncbi:MAG: hypothetical protein F2934_00980 [Actinobacteria bacterium]|uniref:Unannotated protein n=2 Tax=freshwater metagenome TaxID=449393 RepID=A0A6J6UE62_9ZZZZ|nr:hypothetical protein [Actinomycetota bacterium]MSX80054.1 hypothetical protein [Actinomycetota bacterium]MSY12427.1 hypothetical protein [Actinomycetota bacterium]MSZ04181.1 hypothetical protein [Actinomycetota bacterium]MTB05684.1 hypothetical protein [Actinomycetota bacterium]